MRHASAEGKVAYIRHIFIFLINTEFLIFTEFIIITYNFHPVYDFTEFIIFTQQFSLSL